MKIALIISLLLNIILAGAISESEKERCENCECCLRGDNEDNSWDLDMLGY